MISDYIIWGCIIAYFGIAGYMALFVEEWWNKEDE